MDKQGGNGVQKSVLNTNTIELIFKILHYL